MAMSDKDKLAFLQQVRSGKLPKKSESAIIELASEVAPSELEQYEKRLIQIIIERLER
jgi:hypothetical protein